MLLKCCPGYVGNPCVSDLGWDGFERRAVLHEYKIVIVSAVDSIVLRHRKRIMERNFHPNNSICLSFGRQATGIGLIPAHLKNCNPVAVFML